MRVTKLGGTAAALMVVLWVGGLGWGFFYPTSWLGVVIHSPLGLPAYIFAVAGCFGIAASLSEGRGRPFLKKADNVA